MRRCERKITLRSGRVQAAHLERLRRTNVRRQRCEGRRRVVRQRGGTPHKPTVPATSIAPPATSIAPPATSIADAGNIKWVVVNKEFINKFNTNDIWKVSNIQLHDVDTYTYYIEKVSPSPQISNINENPSFLIVNTDNLYEKDDRLKVVQTNVEGNSVLFVKMSPKSKTVFGFHDDDERVKAVVDELRQINTENMKEIFNNEIQFGIQNGITNRNDIEGVHKITPDNDVDDVYFKKQVQQIYQGFADNKNEYYPKNSDVEGILKKSMNSMTTLTNRSIVGKIEIPIGGNLHVIGDIHGNLNALKEYLNAIGEPLTEKNQVLFLGDIIDRGDQEWHCMLLVLLFRLRYPKFCTILRGNHEDAETSQRYGMFQAEKKQLNFSNYNEALSKMKIVFEHLELCCTINNSIFCVHGGPPIYANTLLSKLEKIVLPVEKIDYNSSGPIVELMWNDPRKNIDDVKDSERGLGYQFGSEPLKRWLENNNLKYVLRAHECPEDLGCAVVDTFGNGSCLTVFSAPNYYPPMSTATHTYPGSRNQGGYLLVSNKEHEEELTLSHVVTGEGACISSTTTGCTSNIPISSIGN